MISVYLECGPAELDTLIAELYEHGTLGVIEFGTGVRAWFDSPSGLEELIRRYDGEIQNEPNEDWVRRTEESFPPVAVGQRFWLVPPWNGDPPPPGRLRLEINPGLACGTGWHPCTQLCLEAMERHIRPGVAVLDVGTGSGILSVAAGLLGAGVTVACDNDADASVIAMQRLGGGTVFAGSADAIRADSLDVVVANISAPVIERILPDLQRVCRPAGILILSGFQNPPDLPKVMETTWRDGWMCVVCR